MVARAQSKASEKAAQADSQRFAFILHPLTVDYLSNHPRYAWTRHMPRQFLETTAAYMPAK